MALDFQKRKKKYFDLTLHDGTKLKIPTPTKKIYDELVNLSRDTEAAAKELPGLTRTILATNKDGILITDEQMDDFDIADLYAFFIEYTNYVTEVLSDPNSKSPTAQKKKAAGDPSMIT